MSWYLVYETASGKLVSTGSVLADPLPDDLTAIKIDKEPDFEVNEWDSVSKTMVVKQAEVVVTFADKILAEPELIDLKIVDQDNLRIVLDRFASGRL